jgi:hypothetical protein
MTRDNVRDYILSQLCARFALPRNYFKEADDLRKKWLFDDVSLVAWGKEINQSESHGAYVTPLEMVQCKTIKAVIDLVYSKINS